MENPSGESLSFKARKQRKTAALVDLALPSALCAAGSWQRCCCEELAPREMAREIAPRSTVRRCGRQLGGHGQFGGELGIKRVQCGCELPLGGWVLTANAYVQNVHAEPLRDLCLSHV